MYNTIMLQIALAAKLNWKVYHLDVKSAFLNGMLNEDIFVEKPKDFQIPGTKDKVYKLHRTLYSLKQTPRAWYGIAKFIHITEARVCVQ